MAAKKKAGTGKKKVAAAGSGSGAREAGAGRAASAKSKSGASAGRKPGASVKKKSESGKKRGKNLPSTSGKSVKQSEEVKPMPGDLHKRQWGKPADLLKWLEADGFPLSRQNLYKIYGPKSSKPVKKKEGNLWFYPELLERVRLNRGEGLPQDYNCTNEISLARQRAELRIKETEAEDRQLSLEMKKGNLVKVDELERALNMAAQILETQRRSLCAALPSQLAGMEVLEMHKLLEEKTKAMMAAIRTAFEEAADGS